MYNSICFQTNPADVTIEELELWSPNWQNFCDKHSGSSSTPFRVKATWARLRNDEFIFSSLENGRSVAAKGPLLWSCRLAEIHEGRVETLGKGVLSGTTVCQWRDHYYRPTSFNVRRICMQHPGIIYLYSTMYFTPTRINWSRRSLQSLLIDLIWSDLIWLSHVALIWSVKYFLVVIFRFAF